MNAAKLITSPTPASSITQVVNFVAHFFDEQPKPMAQPASRDKPVCDLLRSEWLQECSEVETLNSLVFGEAPAPVISS